MFSTDTTECVADTEHSLIEQPEFDNPKDQVKEHISEPGLMCSTEECDDLNKEKVKCRMHVGMLI